MAYWPQGPAAQTPNGIPVTRTGSPECQVSLLFKGVVAAAGGRHGPGVIACLQSGTGKQLKVTANLQQCLVAVNQSGTRAHTGNSAHILEQTQNTKLKERA